MWLEKVETSVGIGGGNKEGDRYSLLEGKKITSKNNGFIE